MQRESTSRGRVAVVGAGPGGMAAVLALHRSGFDVDLYEAYPEIKAAGNILNLWPPPQKVLRLIGVDTEDLGAPANSSFRRNDGRIRAEVHLPQAVVDEYGGGFIGLLRWGLYQRMIAALPEGALHMNRRLVRFDDTPDGVTLNFEDGSTATADVLVGADGLRSTVRRQLWGDEPIREQGLHLVGGYLFLDGPPPNDTVIMHDRTTQGSYSAIRHEGRYGYEWWVLEAFDPSKPFDEDLKAWALQRARRFAAPLPRLVADTPPEHLQRWPIRDRKPLKQWSQGRVTLVGDAAHPTSPYAAYGAGMSIEDGYFLASELERIDVADLSAVRRALQAFEDRRKPHTAQVTEMAYRLGRMFHHAPAPLRPIRDAVYDHTPLLQKVIGEQTPGHILKQLAEIDAVEAARPAQRRVATP